MLRDGVGVPRDPDAAVRWFRIAARRGHADAQVSLGYCLFTGTGARRDPAAALTWYRRAAAQRHAGGHLNLAHMLRAGDGAQRDLTRALRHYRQAAQLGNVAAMNWLGRIHTGQEPEFDACDAVLALRWLTRAAERGDPQSMCSLGVVFSNGDGVAPDLLTAVGWYRRAARAREPWATYLLGCCYLDGSGLTRNPRRARHWLARAEALGVTEARDLLRQLAAAG